jgi:hypothetical protein
VHRTQKARGIKLLSETYGLQYTLIDPKKKNNLDAPFVYYPVFARPCPLRPRHGFVDSRVVTDKEELKKLVAEVLDEDPEGEVILMSLIKARYSGVLTNGMAAIGPDNDGVTSGKDGTIQFPIGPLQALEHLAKTAKIEGAPYIEFVNEEVVQLRDGPPVVRSQVTDKWIPKAETVKRVVSSWDSYEDAPYDLIKWEKMVSELEEGDVVHLRGQTMLSHYAVHAVCAERPIFFQDAPMIGDEIEPNYSAPEITEDHIASLRAGIGLATRTNLGMPSKNACAAQLAIFAAHHGPALIEDVYGCFILGMGATFLVRLGFAASFGEYRHNGRSTSGIPRDSIYEEALEQTWRSQINLAMQAGNSFRDHNWRSGYGGSKWAACTDAAVVLARVLAGDVKPKKVLMALNAAIHVAHNNGKWLDKFVDPSTFDLMASGEIRTAIKAIGCLWDFVSHKSTFTPGINAVTELEEYFQEHDNYRANPSYDDHDECSCSECTGEDEDETPDEDETDEFGNEIKSAYTGGEKVVQWSVRGGHVHFQLGTKGEYRTFDLQSLPDLTAEETAYSLAGSTTRYKRTPKEHLKKQAEVLQLVDLKKWLEGQ